MPPDSPQHENSVADVNALVAGSVQARVHNQMLAEVHPPVPKAPAAEPQSYLDKSVGWALGHGAFERHVVEAAKTGAMFFGGRVGMATTIALYGLDQVKCGDNFGQAVSDLGLGALKGTALRGLNSFAAAREMGIAGQAVTLGAGARVLDSGLDRRSWIDGQTKQYSFAAGKESVLRTVTDKGAALTDVASFAIGGGLAHGINRYGEGGLSSSPFWKTVMTGGVFGAATAATSEVKREHDHNEQFSLTKVLQAGAVQGFYSSLAMAPAGWQSSSALRNVFKGTYGVTAVGEKGQYHYRMSVDGKIYDLATSRPTAAGIRETAPKLAEMQASRKVDLANTFGISFANGGENIYMGSGSSRTELVAREPRINELTVLEKVLKQSTPGHLTVDGKTGIKFNFLRDQDGDRSWGGVYEERVNEPNVFLNNSSDQLKPMTGRDYDPLGSRHDDAPRNSVEQILTHEVAHNSDYKVREADHVFEDAIREKLGWHRFGERATVEWDNHVLQAKNGHWYRYQPGDRWMRTDINGEPVDGMGNRVEKDKADYVDNEAMRHMSVVTPISNYFNKPMEMMMEGFSHFRIGGDSRANLLRTSPTLYEQVKIQDDRELGMHYGYLPDGQPTRVRMWDGSVQDRTAENLAIIAKSEQAPSAARVEANKMIAEMIVKNLQEQNATEAK